MRNTIILVVIALALGAYVYFGEIKGGEKRAQEKAKAEKLFTVEKDSIDHIIVNQHGRVYEFKKVNGSWEILKPVKTDADESPINSLLYNIKDVRKIRTFKVSKKDLSKYGLGTENAIVLTFSGKGIPPITVKVGDNTPVGGNVFVAKNDSEIVIVASSLKNSLNKSLFDWRDKKALRFEKDKIVEIKLKNPHGTFDFVKEGNDWKITKPIQTKGENANINSILNKLEFGRIKSVAAEHPKNLYRYGLKPPAFRIELFAGKEKARMGVAFSAPQHGDVIYGKDDARPYVFTVDTFFVKPFNKKLFDYRNKKITQFDRTKADRINLLYKSNLMIFEKDSANTWRLSTGEKAKSWKITNILLAVNNLKATAFVTDHPKSLKPYGLLNPVGRIEVYAGNKKLIELDIGKKKNAKLIYARNPLLKSVVTIKANELKKLFPKKEDLLEPKPKKENKTAGKTDSLKAKKK